MPLYNRYEFGRSDDGERLVIEEVEYPDLMFNYGTTGHDAVKLREANQKKIDVLKGMILELEEANDLCDVLAKPYVVECTRDGERKTYAYRKKKDARKCLDRLTLDSRQNASEGCPDRLTDISVYALEIEDGEVVRGIFDDYYA